MSRCLFYMGEAERSWVLNFLHISILSGNGRKECCNSYSSISAGWGEGPLQQLKATYEATSFFMKYVKHFTSEEEKKNFHKLWLPDF